MKQIFDPESSVRQPPERAWRKPTPIQLTLAKHLSYEDYRKGPPPRAKPPPPQVLPPWMTPVSSGSTWMGANPIAPVVSTGMMTESAETEAFESVDIAEVLPMFAEDKDPQTPTGASADSVTPAAPHRRVRYSRGGVRHRRRGGGSAAPGGGAGSSSSSSPIQNAWNAFQSRFAGMGFTPQQIREAYTSGVSSILGLGGTS